MEYFFFQIFDLGQILDKSWDPVCQVADVIFAKLPSAFDVIDWDKSQRFVHKVDYRHPSPYILDSTNWL